MLISPACAPIDDGAVGKHYQQRLDQLSQEERDYVERFNAVTKDIRDFPPAGEKLDDYFHILKSVNDVEDADYFFFGETHSHSMNYIWSAGAINRLSKPGDLIFFEGAKAGTRINNVAERVSSRIFAAREYEKLNAHRKYDPAGVSKIENNYRELFLRTKDVLTFDILNLKNSTGFFWDLVDERTGKIKKNHALRNESMVQTLKDKSGAHKIFVIAGAMHVPHFEFAHVMAKQTRSPANLANFLAHPNADQTKINNAFYDYFDGTGGKKKANTKSIFDFLVGKKFAVLIPKNLPNYPSIKKFLPHNAE